MNPLKFITAWWRAAGREQAIAWGLLAAAMIFRIVDVFVRPFDSDEPQHLHVVWGWVHGLVQYRDVFDNHAPLFHMLSAPLFWLLPEWSDAIYVMRLAVLPFFILALYCTYKIADRLYSPRVAIWAIVGLALFPRFFGKMLEFRPDSMWAALLTFAIWLMVKKASGNRRRAWWVGLVLGAAMAVSFKTIIFLAAMLIGLGVGIIMAPPEKSTILRLKLADLGLGLLGFLAIPGVIVAFYTALHALPALYYGVIQHNLLANAHHSARTAMPVVRIFVAVLGSLLIWGGAVLMRVEKGEPRQLHARVFVWASGVGFILLLQTFWPLVTHQTQLPALPLLAVSFTALLAGELGKGLQVHSSGMRRFAASGALLCGAVLIEALVLAHYFWVDIHKSARDEWMWRDVLAYTDPSDYVMDAKGETIYRQRPYYYGLETITMQLIASGQLSDNIAECLIRRPTYVVAGNYINRYPKPLRQFIADNYMPAHTLYIAGKWVTHGDFAAGQVVKFNISVPGRYVLLSEQGLVAGNLNGKEGKGVFEFRAGAQQFVPQSGGTALRLVWNKAWERGVLANPGRALHAAKNRQPPVA